MSASPLEGLPQIARRAGNWRNFESFPNLVVDLRRVDVLRDIRSSTGRWTFGQGHEVVYTPPLQHVKLKIPPVTGGK